MLVVSIFGLRCSASEVADFRAFRNRLNLKKLTNFCTSAPLSTMFLFFYLFFLPLCNFYHKKMDKERATDTYLTCRLKSTSSVYSSCKTPLQKRLSAAKKYIEPLSHFYWGFFRSDVSCRRVELLLLLLLHTVTWSVYAHTLQRHGKQPELWNFADCFIHTSE